VIETECSIHDKECLLLNPKFTKFTRILIQLFFNFRIVLTQDGIPYTIALGLLGNMRICSFCEDKRRLNMAA
jgi:hypothetical protein